MMLVRQAMANIEVVSDRNVEDNDPTNVVGTITN